MIPGQDHRQHHEPADDVFPFLDGLRILLACCARCELMELASICREGGACRYTQLTPLITHIVVRQPGADPCPPHCTQNC